MFFHFEIVFSVIERIAAPNGMSPCAIAIMIASLESSEYFSRNVLKVFGGRYIECPNFFNPV